MQGHLMMVIIGFVAIALGLIIYFVTKKCECKYEEWRSKEPGKSRARIITSTYTSTQDDGSIREYAIYNRYAPLFNIIGTYKNVDEYNKILAEREEDKKIEEEETKKRVEEWESKEPIISEFINNSATILLIRYILIIVGIALVILFGLILAVSIPANNYNITHWQEQYEMIKLVEESGSELDNIAISQTKIEYNAWLADVRTSMNYWDNWSTYYWFADEIAQLEYLT